MIADTLSLHNSLYPLNSLLNKYIRKRVIDYHNLVDYEIDQAFLGEKTAQEALDGAQEAVER